MKITQHPLQSFDSSPHFKNIVTNYINGCISVTDEGGTKRKLICEHIIAFPLRNFIKREKKKYGDAFWRGFEIAFFTSI